MKRIQRKREKDWKMPENAKYVGRPTKWGNPFRLAKGGWIEYYSTSPNLENKWQRWSVSRGFEPIDVVELYSMWLRREFFGGNAMLPTPPNIEELEGKDLACFCPPSQPCHVDVIINRFRDVDKGICSICKGQGELENDAVCEECDAKRFGWG